MKNQQAFLRFVQHPLKFSFYLLWKLPSAWLAGVRVKHMGEDKCVTIVPYRWLSQNPFRSTYFACLGMAAEMSTGIPALVFVRGAAPARVSMLVTGMQAEFHKKAVGKTWFTCEEITAIQIAVQTAVTTGEPVSITVHSTGRSADGTLIASFAINWSFKVR